MKKWLFYISVFTLTFCLSYFSFDFFLRSLTKTSLETVTSEIEYYDEKTITTETYLWVDRIDGVSFMLGEPYEKMERSTYLKQPATPLNILLLKQSLDENWSPNNYKRVKVIVSGKVEDHCRVGGVTCCLGQSMSIHVDNVLVVGEIEDYTVPEKFRVTETH